MKAMRLVGFPEAVVRKIPAGLMMDALNWSFPTKMSTVQAFSKQNRLLAFCKPSLELISVRRLLEAVSELGGETMLFERFDHSLSFTNCSAIIADRWRTFSDDRIKGITLGTEGTVNYRNIAKEDILLGGVNFSTSIMGEHPLEVSGYIYRLTCGNGAMSAEQTFKWSRNTESTSILDWFKDRVKAAIELLDAEFEKISHLRDQLIPEHHRAEVLANVFAEYGLSDKIKQLVLVKLTDDPPRHMYDVVQAITNVVNDQDIGESPMMVRRLQKVGGDIAARVAVCPTCYNVKR
jgi:hypothetical protein